MRKINNHIENTWSAIHVDETKTFIEEYLQLCKKHKMFLAPTHEGDVSLHDHMRVVIEEPDDHGCFEVFTRNTLVGLE